MKTQIATTTEQSHRLIACGVDPNSADMYYTNYPNKPNSEMPYIGEIGIRKDLIPAWSLVSLLALLPDGNGQEINFIYDPFDEDRNLINISNPIELSGDVKFYRNDSDYWIVDYDWDGLQGTLPQGKDPIEAVVQAIELLRANNVSLNTPKE